MNEIEKLLLKGKFEDKTPSAAAGEMPILDPALEFFTDMRSRMNHIGIELVQARSMCETYDYYLQIEAQILWKKILAVILLAWYMNAVLALFLR